MSWHDRALCAHHPNPDLWFPTEPGQSSAAIDICLDCPVQRECLAEAIRVNADAGIWAAVTPGLIATIAGRRGAERLGPGLDEVAIDAACRGVMPGGRGYLTPAERAEAVRRLHARGMTDLEVAKRLQISRETASQIRYRAHLPPNVNDGPSDQGESRTA